jgi:YVTN family beta-propeller protein
MKNTLILVSLILFILCAGAASTVEAAPVIGYVVESAGAEQLGIKKEEYKFQKGVEGALVIIEGTKMEAKTNIMGWFWFNDLPDGVYNIAATKEGYHVVTKQVRVQGRSPANVTIVLTRKNLPTGITGNTGTDEVTIPNAVYVAFAAIAAPGSTSATGNSPPIPGSNMTTLQYKSAIAAGADPDSLTGFPNPDMTSFPTGPYEFQTSINFHPNSLTIMDPNAPKDMKFINLKAKPYWLCFDSSGSKLFVSSDSQYITAIDVAGGNRILGSIPSGGIVTDIARGPEGFIYVAVSSTNPGILVINPQTCTAQGFYRIKAQRIPDAQPRALVAGANFIYVAMATSGAGEVLAIHKNGGATAGSCQVGAFPMGITVTPNGQYLFIANCNSSDVSVVDAATMNHLGRIRVGVQPMRIVCNSRGDRVYVTNKGSNYVSVIDARTGSVVATVNTGKGPMGIGITSNGSRVFVANNDERTVTVINAEINTALQTTTPSTTSRPFGIAVRP